MSFTATLKRHFFLLFSLWFLSHLAVLSIESLPSSLFSDHQPLEESAKKLLPLSILCALMSITLFSLTKFYIFFLLGKKAGILKDSTLRGFSHRVFISWIVVELRAQIRTFLYALLLVLPGLIESLRLSLAPLHVFFNPKMEQERFDPIYASKKALGFKESRALIHLALLMGLYLIPYFLMGRDSFFSGDSFFSVINSLLCVITMSVISSVSCVYLFCLFLRKEEKTTKHS